MDTTIYDLLVVGAGPHGLGMVSRYLQGDSGSFSEVERDVITYRIRKDKKANPETKEVEAPKSYLVVDPEGQWLGRWDKNFAAFNIPFLRSTMFMHPDSSDINSFLAFAVRTNRQDELLPITELYHEQPPNQNGRKAGKLKIQHRDEFNEANRNLFYRPSSPLFRDFCEDIVDRLNIRNVVYKAAVVDIIPDGDVFCVKLSDGSIKTAKNVVLSTGLSTPLTPQWFTQLRNPTTNTTTSTTAPTTTSTTTNITATTEPATSANTTKTEEENSTTDTTADNTAHKAETITPKQPIQLSTETQPTTTTPTTTTNAKIPPLRLLHSGEWSNCYAMEKEKMRAAVKGKYVMVVGGGLTSAHLTYNAVEMGCEKVFLVSRKKLIVKLFDVSNPWMGKYRNLQLFHFWNKEEPKDRLAMLLGARQGGSITPEMYKKLLSLVDTGKVKILEDSEVSSVTFCEDQKLGHFDVTICSKQGGEIRKNFDHIWAATGSKLDIKVEPFMQTLVQNYKFDTECGFPILDKDLRLIPSLNLFVMGAYSSLTIGPDARNLFGCVAASNRICNVIEHQTETQTKQHCSKKHNKQNKQQQQTKQKGKQKKFDFTAVGCEGYNRFELFAEEGDE